MAKELKVSISSATSEVAKDNAIAASGQGPGAAEVIRDANGRVTEVRITLPDSAATAASAAISATPGVANVVAVEIPVGSVGIDGSVSPSPWLAFLGGVQNNLPGSIQSTDGDVLTIICNPGLAGFQSGDTVFFAVSEYSNQPGHQSIPTNAFGAVFEMRVKLVTPINSGSRMIVNISDDVDSAVADFTRYNDGGDIQTTISAPAYASSVLPDENFHVYKLEILANGAGHRFSLDGVAQPIVPALGGTGSFTVVSFAAYMEGDGQLQIDYIRWTVI